MTITKIKNDLKAINLKFNEPLAKYTYTETGGPADVLAFPKTVSEVKEVSEYCTVNNIQMTILGNASNLIVSDLGIEGLVMILTDMSACEVVGTELHVEAGAKLIDTALVALEAGLTGLEFACGIPGSIGGAMYMNAGAYGGEVADVVKTVDYITQTGEVKTLTNEELKFSYRHSVFQDEPSIILSVVFALENGDKAVINEKMVELTDLRESKQPLEYPSCGSVFKRPEGHFTGKLIQDAGLQGYQLGGAQVSEKHAGFIVNVDNATATDYVQLIAHIQDVIKEKFDVSLETEVRIIGRK